MKKIAATALLIILSGCASMYKQPMDAAIAPTLKGRPVTYTVRPMPGFSAMTPAKALIGGSFIGAAWALAEGSKIVEENNIDNPTNVIALGLAAEISNRFEMKLMTTPVTISGEVFSEQGISKAAKKSADFVIDVTTQSWGSAVFPLDFTRYRVLYTGSARVINTATAMVIAEGYCSYKSDDVDNAPGYDELFGDGAARFKKEMTLLATNCVKNIQADMRQNNAQ